MENILKNTQKRKKCVIPYSGGADSCSILYNAFNSGEYGEIHCIWFNYNQKHKVEREMVEYNINNLQGMSLLTNIKVFFKEIDITFLRDIAPTSCLTNDNIDVPDGSNSSPDIAPKSYVPNRNMIMISITASYAEAIGAEDIYHGAVAADLDGGYWDCMPRFFECMNDVFKQSNCDTKINIKTPLLYLSKKEIIEMGLRDGVDFRYTWTDYSGGKEIDGVICADAESASSKCRIQGFIDAGLIDPLPYQQDLTELWETHNCVKIK